MNSTTVEGSHTTVVNGGSGGTAAVVSQPITASAIQAQTAPPAAAVAAPPRAPSPLFVSVPPRTSRVLHSEIYQRSLLLITKLPLINYASGIHFHKHYQHLE